MGLKELFGKRLTIEQLVLAEGNRNVENDEGKYYEITRYRTLPDGIHVEWEIKVDGKPYFSRIRDYTSDNRLATQCVMLFEDGMLGTKAVTVYEPPGRWFGDTNVSWRA